MDNYCTYEQIHCFLQDIDDSFKPRLSDRLDLGSYAKKLFSNALCYRKLDSNKRIIGSVLVYCNDLSKKTAYIPIVGVLKDYRGQGIIKKLFKKVETDLRQKGFEYICLETWLSGVALNYYIKDGYYVEHINSDRPDGEVSVHLKKDLKLRQDSFDYIVTPLESSKRFGTSLGINLFYKRDDLFAISGGGSKGRKLCYILKKAQRQNCNAIVTAGSNQSNHVRATAIFSSKLSMKSSMIIHDHEPESYTTNLKLTHLSGAKLTFVDMKDVKEIMDNEVTSFVENADKPFYIYGGGHCVEGAFAYYKAVLELRSQLKDIIPDYIILASGTGTTQAGIEVGVKKLYPKCKVLGVSIAREHSRGAKVIVDSSNELIKALHFDMDLIQNVFFDDSYIGNGYGSVYPELLEMVKEKARSEGMFLDPTYSGKAYYAMLKYIENGIIPKGSNVVFWHTGSLMNLLETEEI